jgi:hypothetical protein
LVKGDPFLESLYWGMVFDFHAWESAFGDKLTSLHYPAAFEATRNAIKNGYPTAVFYNRLGGFLTAERDYPGARAAFLKAMQSKVNFTEAEKHLKNLTIIETRKN